MQNLPYVHFLNREFNLSDLNLSDLDVRGLQRPNINIEELLSKNPNRPNVYDVYMEALRLNTEDVDNHGRGMELGNSRITFNPTAENLVIDDMIANNFGLDLITNSSTALFSKTISGELKRQVTSSILCDDIPNFQLLEGPYHDFLEDLRTDTKLKAFRAKIASVCDGKTLDELEELRKDVQIEINDFFYKVVLKVLGTEKQRHF